MTAGRGLAFSVLIVLLGLTGCMTTPAFVQVSGVPSTININSTVNFTVSGGPGSSAGLWTYTISSNCGGTFTLIAPPGVPNNGPNANPLTVGPTNATGLTIQYNSAGATPGPCTFTITIRTASGRTSTTTVNTGIAVGTIVIQKTAVGGDATFSYTSDIPGNATFTITTSSGSGSQTFSNIAPGAYTVTESAPPVNWSFTSLVCSDPDNGTTVVGQTANIDLDASETVTCTYTNTALAGILIQKTAIGGDDTFGYTSDIPGNATFTITTSSGSGSQFFGGLSPGTYTVTEQAPPTGWDFTNLVCTDPDNGTTVNPVTRTATIDLDPGETITCTYTNTKRGTIVINKTANGGNDTFSYTTSGTGGLPATFSITTSGGSGSQSFANIVPGTHTVTESTPPTGWDFTNLVCTDPDNGTTVVGQTANIDLDPGETITCTYINTKRGTIVINKTANGGNDTFSYTTSGTGGLPATFSITTSGGSGSQSFANIVPGTHTVTESTLPTGWDFTDLVCSDPDNGTTVDIGTRTATVDLDAGETVTCTYTNTFIPLLPSCLAEVAAPALSAGFFRRYTITGLSPGDRAFNYIQVFSTGGLHDTLLQLASAIATATSTCPVTPPAWLLECDDEDGSTYTSLGGTTIAHDSNSVVAGHPVAGSPTYLHVLGYGASALDPHRIYLHFVPAGNLVVYTTDPPDGVARFAPPVPATPTPWMIGQSITTGDADWYKFRVDTIPAGGLTLFVALDTSPDTPTSPHDDVSSWYGVIELRDGNGNLLQSTINRSWIGPSPYGDALAIRITTPGTYIIGIRWFGLGPTPAGYHLTACTATPTVLPARSAEGVTIGEPEELPVEEKEPEGGKEKIR